MILTSSEFRIASASDLHLGHKKVPAAKMVADLYGSFNKSNALAALDVLVLAGDVMDHLLSWPDDDVGVIEDWMSQLLRDCAACNVDLWIVEGTPSHDRKQSKKFVTINESLKIGCRLTYVDDLSIVYFARFGLHVLFVPDEWSDSADKTLAAVHEHMAAAGIKKVDYAVMHGQFEYQLPAVVPGQKHSSDAYLAIVDKLIFIGHVHKFSRNDRIIAQGSHGRISHGEEGPKGYVRATVRSADDYDIEFVENKNATIFRTIELEEVELADAIAACRRIAAELPDDSHVRIRSSPENYSLAQLESEMSSEFINLNWTSIDKKSKDRMRKLAVAAAEKAKLPDVITITPDNIVRLVTEKMLSLPNVTNDVVTRATQQFKELVDAVGFRP